MKNGRESEVYEGTREKGHLCSDVYRASLFGIQGFRPWYKWEERLKS